MNGGLLDGPLSTESSCYQKMITNVFPNLARIASQNGRGLLNGVISRQCAFHNHVSIVRFEWYIAT